MAIVKNGTSVHSIKEFMTTEVAPKYFSDIKNLNELNVGLYGYVTEILANTAKDSYQTITSLFKEGFITEAELPQSIYDHALIYQLSDIFATPATVPFAIYISQEALLKNSTQASDYLYIDIDSNMEFVIEDVPFMLDYDVRVISKKVNNTWSHSAQYIIDKDNAISGLRNPFIHSSTGLNENGRVYVQLDVILHQVSKKTISDTIIQNDKINVVSLPYKFSGQLADFNIYYKGPSDSGYTQLKKQLANTNKLSDPFCFYKLLDDEKLEISFANDDRFFMPAYNSSLYLELYTTLGSDGNFDTYEGSDVRVVGRSEKYSSNRGIVFLGTVRGASSGGANRKDREELREETIKAYSTVKSFTTTGDLNLYFDSLSSTLNTKVAFMKKRDDVFERLYSAFVLFRDSDKNVIPTNTLDLRIYSKDITMSMEQTHRNVVPAGLLYEYYQDPDTSDAYVKVCNDLTMQDNLDEYELTRFLYVNPYLVIVCTNPLSVGFYLNTINQDLLLSHQTLATQSFYQFIIDTINVKRDGLAGEMDYTFTVKLNPTAVLPKEAFHRRKPDSKVTEDTRLFINETDGYEYIDDKNLTVVLELFDSNNDPKIYVQLELIGFDEEYYIFQGKITTNDYISTSQSFQVTGGFKDIQNFEDGTEPILLPTTDCRMNVYTFYQYPDDTEAKSHPFSRFAPLSTFTMTNKYSLSEDTLANFIIPVQEIRSTVEYTMKEQNGKYGFRLEAVPLIKANWFKLEGSKDEFLKNFNYIYEYLQRAMDALTNNYSIDMKFFNTYGYSQHYFVTNMGEEHIDRVNISLSFDVAYTLVANAESLTPQLKEYIKEYTEADSISLVSSPSFYISNLQAACKEKFSGLKYMIFKGINAYSPDIQAVESDVNEANIIQGVIKTDKVIPEYLNIDQIIKNGVKTSQININVL